MRAAISRLSSARASRLERYAKIGFAGLIVSLLAIFALRLHPDQPNTPTSAAIEPSMPTLPGVVTRVVDGDTADVQLDTLVPHIFDD